MGNGQSSEGVSNGRRTPHKLSKPRTINPAPNGLLSPFHGSINSRRNSASRVLPDPCDVSVEHIPGRLPMISAINNQPNERDSRQIERLSVRSLFRSKSSQAPSRRPAEDVTARRPPVRSARPSRANSVTLSVAERSLETQASTFGLSATGSRASINYDLNSYEAQRLLNLLGEGPQDARSVVTEDRLEASETAWRQSNPQTLRDPAMVPAVSISTPNSDASLCTPMRRRSLMTPGIATRPPEPTPEIRRAKARFSLPSTPARRDSLESLRMYSLSVPPPPLLEGGHIPRAVTPNEENYQHTGAFKLGSLRIVNGSPVRSPAMETGHFQRKATEQGDYFLQPASASRTGAEIRGNEQKRVDVAQLKTSPLMPKPHGAESSSLTGVTATESSAMPPTPQFFPDLHVSPLALTPPDVEISDLEVTSKHTATEDQLFEDEEQEFSRPEVLDVRVDLNAKPLPSRPKLISEGTRSQDMGRSDSGLGGSPTSEYPRKQPLAKADSGYSSNVSLYSLTAKQSIRGNGSVRASDGMMVSKARTRSTREPSKPKTPILNTSGIGYASPCNDISSGGSNVKSPSEENRPSPLKHLSTSGRQNLKRLSLKTKSLMSPVSDLGQASSSSELSPASCSSPTEPPALRIGTRKPGKFQRLLTGVHQPLTTHATHPDDNFDVPPVPQAISAKLIAHTDRLSPTSGKIDSVEKGLGDRTEARGIDNGSSRINHDAPTTVPPPYGRGELPSAINASGNGPHKYYESVVVKDASQNQAKSYSGKLVTDKNHSKTSLQDDKHRGHLHAQRKSSESPAHHTVSFAAAQERLASLAHLSYKARSKSMSALVAHGVQHLTHHDKTPSPSDMPTLNRQPRGDDRPAGPESSRCNCPNQPPRAPPENESRPLLSRQPSRDNIFEYSPVNQRHESHQARPTAPPLPALGSRRSMGNMTEVKKMRRSHDYPYPPLNQSMSSLMRRYPSTQFLQSAEVHRPQQGESQAGGCQASWRGAPEPAQVLDPWTRRPISPHWNQTWQSAPSVPRGHFRSFSTETYDQTGYPPPYRVLHSYNSPAYRGVPIWG